ncbi:hypothetical protein [Usitatibacter palustris]|uniref:Phosphoglycerate mutase n=1 Tax=Usitatibacter palustris TaxID=2732487 RepID=A0A6M4H9E6_9PROT|nr:hypothetical protein [Usitatibacter palustris]QJR15468.1 hypothetical protein DSM104440_02289 [Usitatibacter palustris]
MPLTLLVPDLLSPPDAPAEMRGLRLPGIEKWLARSTLARVPARGGDAWLAAEHGLAGEVPHAAIALAGDAGPREGTWMHADPVHLRINRDAVALHDASVLDIGAHEARDFVAALQALFRNDAFTFIAPAPDRWYVCIDSRQAPKTTPLHEAIGRNIFGLLPEGSGTFNWRSAITEAQMVLSNHEANARRERAGQPSVNSVWFWGVGETPANVQRRFRHIHADAPFARGLAALAGSELHAVPASLAALRDVTANEDTLVVLDALTRPRRAANLTAWHDAARELDAHWFADLGQAAANFGGVRLVLPVDDAVKVATISPGARWRFFTARKPLGAHA